MSAKLPRISKSAFDLVIAVKSGKAWHEMAIDRGAAHPEDLAEALALLKRASGRSAIRSQRRGRRSPQLIHPAPHGWPTEEEYEDA